MWREALLAQKVLAGTTRGYRHHPQLDRFRQSRNPTRAIANYLWTVADEAKQRGYDFDISKIGMPRGRVTIPVTTGQTNSRISNRNFVTVTPSDCNWSVNANPSRSIQHSRRWKGQ